MHLKRPTLNFDDSCFFQFLHLNEFNSMSIYGGPSLERPLPGVEPADIGTSGQVQGRGWSVSQGSSSVEPDQQPAQGRDADSDLVPDAHADRNVSQVPAEPRNQTWLLLHADCSLHVSFCSFAAFSVYN